MMLNNSEEKSREGKGTFNIMVTYTEKGKTGMKYIDDQD